MKTCADCYRPAVARVSLKPVCQSHLFLLLDDNPQTEFCLPEANDYTFAPLLLSGKTQRTCALGLHAKLGAA